VYVYKQLKAIELVYQLNVDKYFGVKYGKNRKSKIKGSGKTNYI